MAKINIPTIILRQPIPTHISYDIQGLLLFFGKYRESPYLTDWEKIRLKQLAATGEWLASGGEYIDGLWMKDGIDCYVEEEPASSFIESHFTEHQVSLILAEYDTEWRGCCGMFNDILGNPDIGTEIRDWVEQHGKWTDIKDFVSKRVDVLNPHLRVVPLGVCSAMENCGE